MAVKLDLIDDITKQQARTGFPLKRILGFYGLKKSTYHSWFDNAGQLRPPKDRPLKNDAILPDEEMAVRYGV